MSCVLGSNSKDNGLFGAGFYFGTHAPVWLNDGSDDYRTMKVYLDIKHPFEVSDKASLDIYSEIVKKMDSPAMRGLTITGLNGKQMQVGEDCDGQRYGRPHCCRANFHEHACQLCRVTDGYCIAS